MGTYNVYKHSCEYRSRDFARIVWIVDTAGELVMLTTVETTDDGKNDDGEERNDDAGGKIVSERLCTMSLFIARESVKLAVLVQSTMKTDGQEVRPGRRRRADIPRPCLHRPDDGLHDDEFVAAGAARHSSGSFWQQLKCSEVVALLVPTGQLAIMRFVRGGKIGRQGLS
jgi:hypothetical protein